MNILRKTETHIFLCLTVLYLTLVVWLDNTNITTTNGLYKAIDVRGWETLTKFVVDSGGLLYAVSMAVLCKILPDSWVSFYGDMVPTFVTYRKLAFINTVFGAGVSTVLYHLAFRVTQNKAWSLGVTCVHAFSAFVLINSIISEDIMPAYFFYVLGFLCAFKGLFDGEKRLWFTFATLSILAVLFLHWSLFPVATLTYLIIGIYVCREDPNFIRLLVEQVVLFLSVIFLFCFAANAIGGHLFKSPLKFMQILLPNKASGSWVGFSWLKFEPMLTGIGNYLFGGLNTDKVSFLSHTELLRVCATWVFFLFISFNLWKKRIRLLANPATKLLLVFATCSFVFAQLVNLYSQPQDPQFQLQPMILIPLGLICLYGQTVKKYMNALFAFCCLLAFDNIQRLETFKGNDSKMVTGYKEFRQLFPKETTKLVHVAYEEFSAWLMAFEYPSDLDAYMKAVTMLNRPAHHYPHMSIKEQGQLIMDEIDLALKQGKRIIATGPWLDPNSMMCLTIIHLTPAQITELRHMLLVKYKLKQRYETKWGIFAEIVPND